MDSYAVWGARLGYETGDGHWKVMLWGKNLADEYYVTNLIASSDTTARFIGRPRTYGLTVGYTY
jgi:outer membrane receptor protein involved in Fe transport